jgi:hypothetical protein
MNIYKGLAPLAFYNVPCQSFITQVQRFEQAKSRLNQLSPLSLSLLAAAGSGAFCIFAGEYLIRV